MAAALEERCTWEVLDWNEAIEALKSDIEVMEADKAHLVVEVSNLSSTSAEVRTLRQEGDSLRKQLEEAWTAEALAVEHLSKADEVAYGLWKEVDVEKQSSQALQ